MELNLGEFEVDNNCENLVSENELWGRITEGFRQWNHQWDYYMMTNKNKPINIEKCIPFFNYTKYQIDEYNRRNK